MSLRQLISNNCTISPNTKQIDSSGNVTTSEKHTQGFFHNWKTTRVCTHDTEKVFVLTEMFLTYRFEQKKKLYSHSVSQSKQIEEKVDGQSHKYWHVINYV